MILIPLEAKTVEIGNKPSRGRPTKAKSQKALQRQPTDATQAAEVTQTTEAIPVEVEQTEDGTSDSTQTNLTTKGT